MPVSPMWPWMKVKVIKCGMNGYSSISKTIMWSLTLTLTTLSIQENPDVKLLDKGKLAFWLVSCVLAIARDNFQWNAMFQLRPNSRRSDYVFLTT